MTAHINVVVHKLCSHMTRDCLLAYTLMKYCFVEVDVLGFSNNYYCKHFHDDDNGIQFNLNNIKRCAPEIINN